MITLRLRDVSLLMGDALALMASALTPRGPSQVKGCETARVNMSVTELVRYLTADAARITWNVRSAAHRFLRVRLCVDFEPTNPVGFFRPEKEATDYMKRMRNERAISASGGFRLRRQGDSLSMATSADASINYFRSVFSLVCGPYPGSHTRERTFMPTAVFTQGPCRAAFVGALPCAAGSFTFTTVKRSVLPDLSRRSTGSTQRVTYRPDQGGANATTPFR